VVEPAFTRSRANHPKEAFAEVINKAEVVLVQVSGPRELELYPALNIVMGTQPRGPSEEDMFFMLDICLFCLSIRCMVLLIEVDDIDMLAEVLEDRGISIGMVEDIAKLMVLLPMSIEELSFGPMQSFVPQSKICCGRHCTLPIPFASKLSTQLGKAPVCM